MHTAAYPSPSNPAVSLPRLAILGHPPKGQALLPLPVPAIAKPKPLQEAPPAALVLFGLDDRGKAHGAWFPQGTSEAAVSAAEAMGMLSLPVDVDAVRSLAGQLPQGKIFPSGKAFMPFVKTPFYDELMAHLPESERDRARQPLQASGGKGSAVAGAEATGTGAVTVQRDKPEDWSKIKVGGLVLASDGEGDGWYEADVVEGLPEESSCAGINGLTSPTLCGRSRTSPCCIPGTSSLEAGDHALCRSHHRCAGDRPGQA
ncbi:MAG: hypothetical protein ACT6U0_28505 [Shinella sp.]